MNRFSTAFRLRTSENRGGTERKIAKKKKQNAILTHTIIYPHSRHSTFFKRAILTVRVTYELAGKKKLVHGAKFPGNTTES